MFVFLIVFMIGLAWIYTVFYSRSFSNVNNKFLLFMSGWSLFNVWAAQGYKPQAVQLFVAWTWGMIGIFCIIKWYIEGPLQVFKVSRLTEEEYARFAQALSGMQDLKGRRDK